MPHQLLTIGFNAFGQCTGNPSSNENKPFTITTPTILYTFPASSQCLGVTATWASTIAWTRDEVYVWGFGESTIKIDVGEARIEKVVPVPDNDSCLYVLIGDELSVLSTGRGKKRRRDEEGNTDDADTRTTKGSDTIAEYHKTYTFTTRYKDIATTTTTACALTRSGELQTWSLSSPSEIKTISPPIFTTLTSGQTHFLALSKHKDVYTWGTGLQGQLGHGMVETVVTDVPEAVDVLQGMKVREIAGGAWHSVAVTEDTDVYAFGSNKYGQLGVDDGEEQNTTVPAPLEFNFDSEPCERVLAACGSQHTVVSDGKVVYGCGWNKYGQVGGNSVGGCVGKLERINTPRVGKGTTIVGLACGRWHTVFVVEAED